MCRFRVVGGDIWVRVSRKWGMKHPMHLLTQGARGSVPPHTPARAPADKHCADEPPRNVLVPCTLVSLPARAPTCACGTLHTLRSVQAYTHVAPQVAHYPEYARPLAQHLVGAKLRHWERGTRELAARCVRVCGGRGEEGGGGVAACSPGWRSTP